MKNKFKISFTVNLIFLICSLFAVCIPGYAADFVMDEETVSVSNVPQNGSLIVAAYDINDRMLDCKIYNGTGTISGDYAKDMSAALSDAASIKTFLWDMESIKPLDNDANDVLVVYFSAMGNTEGIANYIIDITSADKYEIVPETPYTSADLNYSNSNCRANREQNDPNARPAISGKIDNIDDYDTIFIGYPIWWGQAPKIIYTFLESYDFGGKTIIPFCTSASSGIGSSATNLHKLAETASWKDGTRFSASTPKSSVASWINSLGLDVETK